MRTRQLMVAILAVGLLVGSLPGTAVAGLAGPVDHATVQDGGNETANGSSASTGQQLATVLEVTDEEVRSDVEESAFERKLETDNETAKAQAIADRATALRERADDIAADQQAATEAYENGDLTDSEYAQRLAVLNARANAVLEAYQNLDDHAEDVSGLKLEAAGYNQTADRQAREQLRSVTGAGANALFRQYTGQSEGEFSVETENGVSLEVESEDGERSREFEREQPGNGTLVVSQSEALQTARGALDDSRLNWSLRKASVDREDGYYEFEFTGRSANATGSAEVSVDGETGGIFEFEEEIEPRGSEADEAEEADEDDNETEDEDADELAISLANGTAEPGATVTLEVTQAGEPVEGATVMVGDQTVGETDADGRITVTLPSNGEADIKATHDDAEGEIEFDFGDTEDRESTIRRNLSVSGSTQNGTVSVAVSYDGEGVDGATVYANGERVGTTGGDGTLTFETNATDELEVTLVKGEFEAELTFEVRDGTLQLADSTLDIDGDSGESDGDSESDDDSSDDSDSDDSDGDDSDSADSDSDDSDEEETETETEETETETETETEEGR